MSLAPFVIDTDAGKLAAIGGLVLLTVQALDIRAWNLVLKSGWNFGIYLCTLF